MQYLIKDVYALDSSMERAKRCDVAIEDGVISDIYPPNTGKGMVTFNGHGECALLPGLVNAHTHAAAVLLRGLGEELPLMEWLTKKIWPVERGFNSDIMHRGTMLAAMEMLKNGTTGFNDMYFFMDGVLDAVKRCGMRAALCECVMSETEYRVDKWLELGKHMGRGNRLMRAFLGPHSPYIVCEDQLAAMAQVAKLNGAGVHIHWLETEWEVGYFRDTLKADPVDLLYRTGMIDVPNLVIAHGVWFTEAQIAHLARPNVTIVHCPCSNLKLGSGVARVPQMLAAGVNVALGTDGAASNNRLDMWGEMRTAALLHKGVGRNPTITGAREVLRMATLNGARAMGFAGLGLIQPEYGADFVAVNLNKPHYNGFDEDNLASFIVYAGSARDVAATFVNGRKLYSGGEFEMLNPKKITRAASDARHAAITAARLKV